MTKIVVLLAALTATPTVDVTTVEGDTLSGALSQVTSEKVILAGEKGPRAVPIESVLSVRFPPHETRPEAPASSTAVLFQAGGLLSCEAVTLRDRTLIADPLLTESIEAPLPAIAALRFRALDPAVSEDWSEVIENAPPRDLLVVRNGESLDRVEGTISALDQETLTFLVGDQRVAIDRSKPRLFGVAVAHSADAAEKSICDIRLQNGDWISVSKLEYAGELLTATAAGGWKIQMSLDSIAELDFGRGRIRYLSDIEPREMTHTPFLEVEFDKVFDVRRDRSDAGPDVPIRIEGTPYRKGLVIHSRTELLYRLNGEFQRFVAVAGIEDLVRPHGSIELTITLDGKDVLQKTITGTDAPIPIDLNVAGARNMTILVDFADNWDTGDHLALGEARLIK